MKLVLYSIMCVFAIPILVYGAFRQQYNLDPESVYVRSPNLFSGKWEKVAYSDNFSEYIHPSKIERNLDSTIEVITLRNYYKPQVENSNDKKIVYKSNVSLETIDCYHQTVTVNKIYLISGHFADGPLVEEPIEPVSKPIIVSEGSIGLSKISKICELVNKESYSTFDKSSFMKNI